MIILAKLTLSQLNKRLGKLHTANYPLVNKNRVCSQHQLYASRATEYVLVICNSDRAFVLWPGRHQTIINLAVPGQPSDRIRMPVLHKAVTVVRNLHYELRWIY